MILAQAFTVLLATICICIAVLVVFITGYVILQMLKGNSMKVNKRK